MERPIQTGSSPSASVSSRKRDGDALDLLERPGGPKRRPTPLPDNDPWRESSPFGSSSPDVSPDGIDILDLTGFDVDADSTAIAEIIRKEESERAQEQLILENQELSPSRKDQDTAAPRPGDAQHATGGSLSGAIASGPMSWSAPGTSNGQGGNQSLETPPAPFTFSLQRPLGTVHDQSGQTSQHAPSFNGPSNRQTFDLEAGMNYRMAMPPTRYHVGSPMPGPEGLSDIINKTRMLDYAMGVDEFGRPLPARLQDYLADTFYDPAVTQRDLENLLRNIQADQDEFKLKTDNTPKGLKSKLYSHQALALTWMHDMEGGTNKGGILADDMGLGKTVTTLALLLSRPATSKSKTNLIIGPLSLIRQWEEEIKNKIEPSHRLSVFIYHNKKASTDDLLRHDVVLTTYGTIAKEQKRVEDFYMANKENKLDPSDPSLRTRFPLLHPGKAAFHRVILDEAQFIKNNKTETAKACQQVNATFRWCLTGTPMMNSPFELYSLVRFLRILPYSIWDNFRDTFGALIGKSGSKHVAMSRLRALLKAIMLRRKKDSKIDGKPILVLPEKTEEVVYADLSKDERDYYNQLEKKSQVEFNTYIRDGGIGKNYSSILVLLLRLRQACCHPHLNLDVVDAAPTITDTNLMQLVSKLNMTVVSLIKATDIQECPICYDFAQSPTFFPCGHMSCSQCLVRLTDVARSSHLRNGVESNTAKCPVCRATFVPQDCFTYDVFQRVHMPEAIEARKQADKETKEDPEDTKKEIKQEKLVNIKPSMLRQLRSDASKSREAYEKYMAYLRQNWLPAAKVSQCIKLLKQAIKEEAKVIVFSQWTLLLDLMEIGLAFEEQFKAGSGNEIRRYDGSMSSDERFNAAREFGGEKSVKVMLVSLRAGNAGLNLTAASRVIIMDPFWNPYIERQAIDRAYRIGQEKNVRVYRILTKETVEDRIVALQEKKEQMVEAALDENEGRKISRLGEAELRFLFNTRR